MEAKRTNIGKTLRDLRRQKNMTGGELAKRSGLSQPKISRIENGVATPKQAELEKILNILEAPQDILQQLTDIIQSRPAAARKVKGRYGEGQYAITNEIGRQAKLKRTFVFNAIPLELQTAEYRRSLLNYLELEPKEIVARMRMSNDRQDALWEGRQRYHLLMHEAALYTMPATRPVQLAQLDRIERTLGLRNVKIGILPVQAGLTTTEHGSFVLFDEDYLFVTLPGAQTKIRDTNEIQIYSKLFAQLGRLAAYDDECLHLITKAKKYFS